jgi:AcrR family transcriptional regulator
MLVPPRILRAQADRLAGGLPSFTARERERHELIIKTGQALMSEHGRLAITFANLAVALRIGTGTLRRHFTDLDALLGEIVTRHLRDILRRFAAIPHETPRRQEHLRAAYFAATRRPWGGLTEAHLLVTRDRHLLPDDVLRPIVACHREIGIIIAPEQAIEALQLLDCPWFDPSFTEPVLALLAGRDRDPEPLPQVTLVPVPEFPPYLPPPGDMNYRCSDAVLAKVLEHPLSPLVPAKPDPAPKQLSPLIRHKRRS